MVNTKQSNSDGNHTTQKEGRVKLEGRHKPPN